MKDDYYMRLLYTSIAQNHKTIIDLAIAAAYDPSINNQIVRVIGSLSKSNAHLKRLVENKKITLSIKKPVTDHTPST